jgi:membrane protease YdiL (CAAX protease family)
MEYERIDWIAMGAGLALAGLSLFFWIRLWMKGTSAPVVGLEREVEPWSNNWVDLMLVVWTAALLYLGISLGIMRFVFPAGFDPGYERLEGLEPSWYTLLLSMSIQWALLVTVLGAWRAFHVRYFDRSMGDGAAWIALDKLLRYLPFVWLAAAFSMWIARETGIGDGDQEAVRMMQDMRDPLKFAAMALLAMVGAPFLEELVFRGLVLRFLVGQFKPMVALVISSLFFGLVHFHVQSFLPITVLGFLLGKAYLDTRDLRVAVWMHVIFNSLTVSMLVIERWIL